MVFREATIDDIAQMHLVRMSVMENRLINPGLVQFKDYMHFLAKDGKGWVCTIDDLLVGFAIIDITGKNIWALFIHPDYEKSGIGRNLHDRMVNWYFQNFKETIWLSTAPQTRAEAFYRKAGWQETGTTTSGEIKFIMTPELWLARKS